MERVAKGEAYNIVAGEARRLAKVLPSAVVRKVASAVSESDMRNSASAKVRVLQELSHPQYRNLAVGFLKACEPYADAVSAEAMALALITAAQGEVERQQEKTIELVWTGPDVGAIPLRRTEQALLQIIESAIDRLLVVSYAVYNVPLVCDALVSAAGRGVAIQLVVETPDRIHGEAAYNTVKALGSAVERACDVFFWPASNRKKDANGKAGILHVKCAVADGHKLFLSSANLTQYAFDLNMELGILTTGGSAPPQVEEHFRKMIRDRVLERICVS